MFFQPLVIVGELAPASLTRFSADSQRRRVRPNRRIGTSRNQEVNADRLCRNSLQPLTIITNQSKNVTRFSRRLFGIILITTCFGPCVVNATEASQISMAQQLRPGELAFVILSRRADGMTFSSTLGLGKLDFRVVQQIPAGVFEAVQRYFDDGSLAEYRAEEPAELNMADPDFYTLVVDYGEGKTTTFRVPIDDRDRGMDVVELLTGLLPSDYRSRRNKEFDP